MEGDPSLSAPNTGSICIARQVSCPSGVTEAGLTPLIRVVAGIPTTRRQSYDAQQVTSAAIQHRAYTRALFA